MNAAPVTFNSPAWLLLLLLLPVVWWLARRSLSGLGPLRRWVAIVLRSAVLVLLVAALAEIEWVHRSDRLTVVYLLDQSLSIPRAQRAALVAYVNRSIVEQREGEDRAGVIVFAREANIEIPPFDEDVQLAANMESLLDPDYTNLAGAIKLAQASFPEDSARRLVIISDGNQNLGDAQEQARAATEAGIALDVVPISYRVRREVTVEKLAMAPEIRKGQPFDMRIVLNNLSPPEPGGGPVVSGRLIISQQGEDQPVVISDEHVDLPPGKRVFTVRQNIDRPSFYKYEARFVPDRPADDAMPQNNRATAFTHVRGSGRVLLVEDFEHRGAHAGLVKSLEKENIEVVVRASNQAFNGLEELQQFEAVILADAPREHFSDAQVTMLARNTHDLGGGLIMVGGPNSFGAGGWTNTEVEAALPVDCQIKSAKVKAKGALALVMHASEMADGNHWQKVVAQEAIKALGAEDYCGVLHWNGTERWLWGGMIPVGRQRDLMLARVDRMMPGDMPAFDPTMLMAQRGFAALVDAAVKHMVIISDGDPAAPTRGVIAGLKALNVTISTVAVGCHGPAESQTLKDVADSTGGKYYEVRDARALPKIFQREARRVARPLVFEDANGFRPELKFTHEITSGIVGPLPPLTGFVLTTLKQNPLVELAIVSPVPAVPENNTILAAWTYGLGKSAAFTTDTGERWAKGWTLWDNYDKLFRQMVRWCMRPAGQEGKFAVATDLADGRVNVVVTALDKSDKLLNFLDLGGSVIRPDMASKPLELEQTAPGRYVGSFAAGDPGSYFLLLSAGSQGSVRAGVNVPYSPEFLDLEPDEPLLGRLAALVPAGGEPGRTIEGAAEPVDLEQLLETNVFRHDLPPATRTEDAWPQVLLVATCLFLADIIVRRVALDFGTFRAVAAKAWARWRGRAAQTAGAHLERLRSRKAEVAHEIEQRRSAARFEPTTEAPAELPAAESAQPKEPPSKPPAPPSIAPDEKTEAEDYTSRLLKAKKQVWKDREKPKPDEEK